MHNLRLELEERYPKLHFEPVIGDIRIERRLDFAFRTYRPPGGISRCGLQACSADGRESMRGGVGERGGNAQRGGQMHWVRRGEDGDDLDGQGREPDERDGLHEASGGDLCAVVGTGRWTEQDSGKDEIRDDALRKCAGARTEALFPASGSRSPKAVR